MRIELKPIHKSKGRPQKGRPFFPSCGPALLWRLRERPPSRKPQCSSWQQNWCSRSPQVVAIGDAGWSSPVARQAHNLKVAGSNPAPATNPQRSSGRIYQMWFGVCRRGPFWGVVSAPLDGPAPKHAHSLAREVVGIGPRLPNRSRAWRTRASSCAALICLPSYFVCYDCGPGGG